MTQTDELTKVALIGKGNMGGALYEAMIKTPSVEVRVYGRNDNKPPALEADIIMIAVKPKDIEGTIEQLGEGACEFSGQFWTVAAAPKMAVYEKLLPKAKIARLMPNTPVAVGAGVVGAVISGWVQGRQRDEVTRSLETVLQHAGHLCLLDSEEQLPYLTAISGSGPAYYFAFTESLAKAGVSLGLDAKTSENLARWTAEGAGKLLAEDSRSAEELRIAVTSPGGTTEAALKQFAKDGLDNVVSRAVKRCVERMLEMG